MDGFRDSFPDLACADVKSGENIFGVEAHAGQDPATGWGVLNLYRLITESETLADVYHFLTSKRQKDVQEAPWRMRQP